MSSKMLTYIAVPKMFLFIKIFLERGPFNESIERFYLDFLKKLRPHRNNHLWSIIMLAFWENAMNEPEKHRNWFC